VFEKLQLRKLVDQWGLASELQSELKLAALGASNEFVFRKVWIGWCVDRMLPTWVALAVLSHRRLVIPKPAIQHPLAAQLAVSSTSPVISVHFEFEFALEVARAFQ